MPGTLQSDKLGDIFEVLAKDVLITARQYRYGANTQFDQPFKCGWVVQYIQRDEVDAFVRKKLFRSQATASTGLGEKNKFSAGVFHKSSLDLMVQPSAQVSIARATVNLPPVKSLGAARLSVIALDRIGRAVL